MPTVLCWITRTELPTMTSARTTTANSAISSTTIRFSLLERGVAARRRRGDHECRDPLHLDDLDTAADRDRLLVVVTAGRPSLAADLDLPGLELGDRAGDDADAALHRVDAGADARRLAGGPLERRAGEEEASDREDREGGQLDRHAQSGGGERGGDDRGEAEGDGDERRRGGFGDPQNDRNDHPKHPGLNTSQQ